MHCLPPIAVPVESMTKKQPHAKLNDLALYLLPRLQLLYNVKQRQFPKELFEVRMYALRPR